MRNLVLADSPDFEGLGQAAAAEAWRALPGFEGKSELGTWIYTICYRVLANHRRWWRRYNLRFSLGVDDVFANRAPWSSYRGSRTPTEPSHRVGRLRRHARGRGARQAPLRRREFQRQAAGRLGARE